MYESEELGMMKEQKITLPLPAHHWSLVTSLELPFRGEVPPCFRYGTKKSTLVKLTGSWDFPTPFTKQNQVFHVANRAFCGGNWLVVQGCGKSIFHEVCVQDARRIGVTVLRVKSEELQNRTNSYDILGGNDGLTMLLAKLIVNLEDR